MSELEQDELVRAILNNNGKLPTQVSGISVNQEFQAPEDNWIQIVGGFEKLQHQFRNSPTPLSRIRKNCVIRIGNTLKVLGFSPDKQLALVENLTGYTGTLCPSGIMFFISIEELATFDSKYKVQLVKLEKRENLVHQILSEREEILKNLDDLNEFSIQVSGLSINQEIPVPEDEWVELARDVINPYYVQTNFENVSNSFAMTRKERAKLMRENQTQVIDEAGTRCIIEKRGRLKILGFSSDKQFALLENLDGRRGSPCPSGAVFLMDVEKLATFEKKYEEIIQQDIMIDTLLSNRGVFGKLTNIILARQFPTQVSNIAIDQEIYTPRRIQGELVEDIVYEYKNYGYREQSAGSICSINRGGKIKILEFSQDGQFSLIEVLDDSYLCPKGAILLTKVRDLTANFEHDYAEIL